MNKLPYYYQQSWGVGTNLQLHSLRQAWRLWKELQFKKNDKIKDSRIRERCVVIVDLLGLSLSQLLGQNFSKSNTDKVPPPKSLLESFLNSSDLPKNTESDIRNRFEKFITFYDDIRHFGVSKHDTIDQLTFEETERFINLTIELWDYVCNHYKSKKETSICFKSIREIIEITDDDESEDEW